jgi:uncharacterized RDD family membrane protein YckC
MKKARKLPIAIVAMFLGLAASYTAAQTPAPAVTVEPTRQESETARWSTRYVAVRFGQDFTLGPRDSVRQVVVINGSATIAGYVRHDVTVVFGTLNVASTAVIDGSIVLIGGNASVDPGAQVRHDLLIAGGTIDSPAGFAPGGDHLVIGATPVVERVKAFLPWITEGLLLGRPIVPRLRWVWMVLFVFFLVSLALNLIFLDAVRLSAASLAARPLSAFLVGLLVLLLTGPLAIILAASVVGLAVVPFLFCAIAIAWILGKVGVAVWMGGNVIGTSVPEARPAATLAFVIGFVLISLAYMVPVLGFIVYGLVGVLGLGAATLAFITAYRRENPTPPKRVPPPADVPPPPPVTFAPPPLVNGPSAEGSASSQALLQFPLADFIDRLCAFGIDVALVLIVSGSLDLMDDAGGPILLMLAYHVGFWTWKGTTVGGIICQLRVVRAGSEPLRFVDALVRGLAGILSIAVFGLGFLWVLKDPERQGWHDRVAGTYVVKVPRNYPLP